jgi:hypothetical protein
LYVPILANHRSTHLQALELTDETFLCKIRVTYRAEDQAVVLRRNPSLQEYGLLDLLLLLSAANLQAAQPKKPVKMPGAYGHQHQGMESGTARRT